MLPTHRGLVRLVLAARIGRPDKVDAELDNGVLRITIGKKPEVAPKRIQVNGHAETPKQVGA